MNYDHVFFNTLSAYYNVIMMLIVGIISRFCQQTIGRVRNDLFSKRHFWQGYLLSAFVLWAACWFFRGSYGQPTCDEFDNCSGGFPVTPVQRKEHTMECFLILLPAVLVGAYMGMEAKNRRIILLKQPVQVNVHEQTNGLE